MKLHRFIGDFNFNNRQLEVNDPEIFNQVKNIFSLKSGDNIILSDGKGQEAVAKITGLTGKALKLEIVSVQENDKDPKRQVILYCSILKRENFELVAQKATEVGVKEIVPLITQHKNQEFDKDHLEKIIKKTAEQSGRAIVPILSGPISFKSALEKSGENDLNFFFDFRGQPWSPVKQESARVGIFIGPEGGWDESEMKLILRLQEEEKIKIINLGLLTLRSETAAIIASYLALQ